MFIYQKLLTLWCYGYVSFIAIHFIYFVASFEAVPQKLYYWLDLKVFLFFFNHSCFGATLFICFHNGHLSVPQLVTPSLLVFFTRKIGIQYYLLNVKWWTKNWNWKKILFMIVGFMFIMWLNFRLIEQSISHTVLGVLLQFFISTLWF